MEPPEHVLRPRPHVAETMASASGCDGAQAAAARPFGPNHGGGLPQLRVFRSPLLPSPSWPLRSCQEFPIIPGLAAGGAISRPGEPEMLVVLCEHRSITPTDTSVPSRGARQAKVRRAHTS